MRYFKKSLVSGLLILAIIAGGCGADTVLSSGSSLVISEVVSSNSNSFDDSVIGNPDWIEICNTTNHDIDLTGYSISETSSNVYVFGEQVLRAGEYLVLYCCTPVENAPEEVLFTGFKLSKSGTKLTLSSPRASIQQLEIPELETDISYGIDKNGHYGFYALPTPGKCNDGTCSETLEALREILSTGLRISEVMPLGLDQPYGWAELYNGSDQPVELSNYYITDNPSDPQKARLPKKRLQSGEYTIIYFSDQTGENEVPFSIGSSDTSLGISDSSGTVIHSVTWSTDIISGVSCAKDVTETVYFAHPTPGEKNNSEFLDSVSVKEGIGEVQVTEVLVENSFSIIDEDGERCGWVELHNASAQKCKLREFALSDNEDKLLKWRLPDIELEPDTYIIVYLSGKDRQGQELHANFKLSRGEQLFLTNLTKHTVQTITLPESSKDNISYGVSESGQWLFYPQPTPLKVNDTAGFLEIAALNTDACSLKINEVVAVGQAKKNHTDWIELHNEQTTEVDLEGYYLSDCRSDLKKWPLDTKIEAQGYTVVNRCKKDGKSPDISIAMNGEMLYLTNPQGMVIDQFNTGVLRPGISKGICRVGGEQTTELFSKPTPGKENTSDPIDGYCAVPEFSVGGGYQTQPVTLEISSRTDGARVYYTLDGSTPTEKSKKYTEPIIISKTQTVRAVTIAENMLDSDDTVATYLYEESHSLPVVCLSMTHGDLKYVFGSPERQQPRERGGYVEYYEADGTLGVRFPAGFRIAGAGTRLYPQRSINLYLRGGYGKSSVTYPFFNGYDITTFESLSLRNMGQDDVSTRLRDAYCSVAANGMNIDNMQAKFAVVYINGEYYGLYEFKENQNEDYLASKHGINPDDVEMVRANTYAYQGDSRDIKSLFSLAKGNTNDPDRFKKYTDRADSDYFMDYVIAQTFFSNTDMYNQKYVHTTDNTLKWRPVLYDLDWGFKNSPKTSVFGRFFRSEPIWLSELVGDDGQPKLDENGEVKRNYVDMALFYGFFKNKEWRAQFVERYAEVLNTILTDEKLLSTFDAMVASVESEMPRTIARWGKPSSMNKWESEVKKMRDNIAARREYAIANLQSFFHLSDERIKELFPNG